MEAFACGRIGFYRFANSAHPADNRLGSRAQELGRHCRRHRAWIVGRNFSKETTRYILFKFILKKSRTWQEGIFVGLGHGGTEAIILGILAGVSFARMLALRNVDLSTVPSIPADQLALAKQQLAAFLSTPIYIALLGVVERIFAICLHVSLSVMVLYGIAVNRPAWYGLAVLWHTVVDGVAEYLGLLKVNTLTIEGLIGLMAIVSIGLVFALRGKFPAAAPEVAPAEINNP